MDKNKMQLKVIIQKYHLKQSRQPKKAALISIQQSVTADNFSSLQRELLNVIKGNFDAYLLRPAETSTVNAYTLKVLLAFQNTRPGLTGILPTEALQRLLCYAGLSSLFITADKPGALIARIESGKHSRENGAELKGSRTIQ